MPSAITDHIPPADEVKEKVKDSLSGAADSLKHQIVSRPAASLAVAAVAGILLGLMMKRK